MSAERDEIERLRNELSSLADKYDAEDKRVHAEMTRLETALTAERAKAAALRDAVSATTASLAAAISLLERGGKKAAPSDRMFAQMLIDYQRAADKGRAGLTTSGAELAAAIEAVLAAQGFVNGGRMVSALADLRRAWHATRPAEPNLADMRPNASGFCDP